MYGASFFGIIANNAVSDQAGMIPSTSMNLQAFNFQYQSSFPFSSLPKYSSLYDISAVLGSKPSSSRRLLCSIVVAICAIIVNARPADSPASMWLIDLVFVTQQYITYDEILAA